PSMKSLRQPRADPQQGTTKELGIHVASLTLREIRFRGWRASPFRWDETWVPTPTFVSNLKWRSEAVDRRMVLAFEIRNNRLGINGQMCVPADVSFFRWT